DKKVNSLDLRIISVRVQGPLEERHWVRPKNFDLFFSQDVPKTASDRRQYARDVLRRFATKAFRRPVDNQTVKRLLAIAEGVYKLPDKCFEEGIGQAMVAVLASPRFLFRVEETDTSGTAVDLTATETPGKAAPNPNRNPNRSSDSESRSESK